MNRKLQQCKSAAVFSMASRWRPHLDLYSAPITSKASQAPPAQYYRSSGCDWSIQGKGRKGDIAGIYSRVRGCSTPDYFCLVLQSQPKL
ncbi:hypothetical protein GDO81_019873 [Engystomops pustulosus]|uniref:Uncharacterized protein n=1 Tax=Engystomops pustulosus TaxID=76066 RepID=A0AAV6YTS0_ENGPU|nr:hypothetical protein GDO81_019873 [Engystomops pustulosus]